MNPEERAQLVLEISHALNANPVPLSDEERRWVRMAIQKEAQSIEFRKAIIEKSIMGVIALFGSIIVYVFIDFFKSHGFK